MSKENDSEYLDMRICSVEAISDVWSIIVEDGWVFWVAKEWGVEPHSGDIARFYCKGVGFPIRGLDINGRECYYRTPEEEADRHTQWVTDNEIKNKAEFEQNRASLDAQYDALPAVFKRRIDKFRANNQDFRWEYESYEMFVCIEAIKIADALKTSDAIREWSKKDFEEQGRFVPELYEGHSYNTFDAACRLAMLYLENPEGVVKQYGALAPLVGSKEYGCIS